MPTSDDRDVPAATLDRVEPLPDRHFKTWTIDEVRAASDGEEIYYVPGSKRRVPGPRPKLLQAMEAAGVTVAGDLRYPEYDRLSFSLVTWPMGRGVPIGT